VLGIRDILVWIQIPGSGPLTNGSGSRSNSGSDYFLHWFKDGKNIFFDITFPQAHNLQTKKLIFLLKFCVKILFCRHYFSPLNTFMRKRKDSDPNLLLMDPDPDQGGPKTYGSCGCGSPTLPLTVDIKLLGINQENDRD
jgi:hypothetical protein